GSKSGSPTLKESTSCPSARSRRARSVMVTVADAVRVDRRSASGSADIRSPYHPLPATSTDIHAPLGKEAAVSAVGGRVVVDQHAHPTCRPYTVRRSQFQGNHR